MSALCMYTCVQGNKLFVHSFNKLVILLGLAVNRYPAFKPVNYSQRGNAHFCATTNEKRQTTWAYRGSRSLKLLKLNVPSGILDVSANTSLFECRIWLGSCSRYFQNCALLYFFIVTRGLNNCPIWA